jgi:diguanylate cyclase (GGDEF)-like protein
MKSEADLLDPPDNPPRILLVGPQAQALSSMLAGHYSTAQGVLEAVLVSSPAVSVIVVDTVPETDHLESAIRSLRGVNPAARIVLLATPAEEAACRRALSWGADQYEIMPLDPSTVLQLCAPGAALQRAAPTAYARRALNPAAGVDAGPLPAVPLMVQTGLLEEILEGAGVHPDFPRRSTEILQRHLEMKGIVRFQSSAMAEPPLSGPEVLRREVSFAGQAPFGSLLWQPEPVATAEASACAMQVALLAQAGHWLAAMLALSQRYDQLRSLAATDELSGAYNRRYFTKFMTRLLERAEEQRFRVTLLLFDIDDFKKYNDQFGHASGDAIIRELVKLLRLCTRADDLVARIGGDEFAVVFWDSEAPRQPNSEHPRDALAATERFREALKNHRWPEACRVKGTISISGGLASFPWHARSLESLMAKADEALLQAKAAGKNVIHMTPATEVQTESAA